MSQQEHAQAPVKAHRIRQTRKANGSIAQVQQCPPNDDKEAWKAHWEKQGQSWRTEPEISKDRQTYLAQCLDIKPDFKQDRYPFKGVRLCREDIEWLCGQK